MICWSCEKRVEPAMFCPSCKALLPPEGPRDHFQALGVPRGFSLDRAAAEARWKALSRDVHPDRHARSEPAARQAAMAWTIRLNDAWHTLRDDMRRAEYLLTLAGLQVSTAGQQGAKQDAETVRLRVPEGLLVEMLEKREALADARLADDDATVAALGAEFRARHQRELARMGAALDRGDDLELAAQAFAALKYYDRFLDEVTAHEDARALRMGREGPSGGRHA
jgi:molecular chaperone HscB